MYRFLCKFTANLAISETFQQKTKAVKQIGKQCKVGIATRNNISRKKAGKYFDLPYFSISLRI